MSDKIEPVAAELDALRAENTRLRLTLSRSDSDEMQLLRAENERLRATLTEIMQGARSLDYAIHLARVELGRDKYRNV